MFDKHSQRSILNFLKQEEIKKNTLYHKIKCKIDFNMGIFGDLPYFDYLIYCDEKISIFEVYNRASLIKIKYTLDTNTILNSNKKYNELLKESMISEEIISLFNIQTPSYIDVINYYSSDFFVRKIRNIDTHNFQIKCHPTYLEIKYNNNISTFDKDFKVNGEIWFNANNKKITPFILFKTPDEILNYKPKINTFVNSYNDNLEKLELLKYQMRIIETNMLSDKKAIKNIMELDTINEANFIDGDNIQSVSLVYEGDSFDILFKTKKITH